MAPNAAARHESGQAYGVDARYRKKWRLIGIAGMTAAIVLVLLAFVVAGAGNGPVEATFAIFGILIFGGMAVLIFGVNRTSENDSLVVSADGLTVKPRASKRNLGKIEVFILSLLGDRQPECVAGITRYLESGSLGRGPSSRA